MFVNEGAFIVAAILLNITPGPDHIYVLSRTLVQGKFFGFISSLGVCTGAVIHILAAAFGFSVIIKSSPLIYAVFKYSCALYLLHLGVRQFRHSAIKFNKFSGKKAEALSLGRVYWQGVVIDVLNPKVALFFLAFLPQFISPESVGHVVPFTILGLIVVAISILWESVIIMFSGFMLGRFLQSSRAVNFLNYSMGAVFILLAVQFVF